MLDDGDALQAGGVDIDIKIVEAGRGLFGAIVADGNVMASGGIEIEAGNAAEFNAVFHLTGRDDEFTEIGKGDRSGAIAEGAGGLDGRANIGCENGSGAGQENESGSREKTLGHGRDGDRRLGANDYSFGGNFNRLKNLVAGNGGVYYSPTVRSFDSSGVAVIASLIRYAGAQSPGRPIILSCASMGSQVCWGIARDADSVKRLKGMV